MAQSNSRQFQLNRRQLLLATGLGTAGLFLPSLLPRRARADGPIKRIVIMTTQHGTVLPSWRMLRNNTDYGDWEYPFDDSDPMSFSDILRPLHPYRQKLLVIEGLSLASAFGDKATNNHNAGHMHALTAAKMISDTSAGGASVDQIIAKAIAVQGRIPSLELATRNPWIGGMVNLDADMRAPVEIDPTKVFARLFPTGAPMMQEPTERDKIGMARKSVLDFVGGEYEQVLPKLGKDDRARLSMHRDLIRDLEQRLGVLSSLMCGAPDAPGQTPNSQITTGKAFADLTAAAFACDLTRVATIQLTQLDNAEFGAPPGDVHQDFAHQEFSDANAAKYMTDYNAKQAELFAYLLQALDRYTEGNGTLLDNTLVVWTGELANGPHDLDKIPIVIGGSGGGAFKVGRYVSFAQNSPNPAEHPDWGDQYKRPIGPGHSHFLISLMQAMGLPNNEIGMTSAVTRDGKNLTVDLTGPLPRLT